jgi:oligoribonuclease NrnB/cAMP/cGMP phosphodiesterase (DHH superfamily)
MKPICFYHKADLDGVCSAAIVKHFVPECELYGIDYGDEFPWDLVRPGPEADTDPLWMHLFKPENGYKCGDNWETLTVKKRTVYMVDISLPYEGMVRLAEVSNLTWLDHHKTALEANEGLRARGMRDTTRAACELAWVWMSLFPDPEKMPDSYTFEEFDGDLPEAVRLLGRYDVWDKDHPEWESRILPFQYGMRTFKWSYDPNSTSWSTLFAANSAVTEFVARVVAHGESILRYQAEVNRKACEAGAHEFVWTMPDPELQPRTETDKDGNTVLIQPTGMKFKVVDGKCKRVPNSVMPSYRVLACNTTTHNSQFFDGFYDPEKHDVMCAYSRRSDGKWKVSLYSDKPTIDCGEIAKSFGGGGHKGAAGFACNHLPWVRITP